MTMIKPRIHATSFLVSIEAFSNYFHSDILFGLISNYFVQDYARKCVEYYFGQEFLDEQANFKPKKELTDNERRLFLYHPGFIEILPGVHRTNQAQYSFGGYHLIEK